jgi:hypothetical protein
MSNYPSLIKISEIDPARRPLPVFEELKLAANAGAKSEYQDDLVQGIYLARRISAAPHNTFYLLTTSRPLLIFISRVT